MTQWGLLRWIELILLVVLVGMVLHAPFIMYTGSVWPEIATEVKAWKELLLLLAGLLTLIYLYREKLFSEVLRDRILQLSLGFIALHFVLLPFGDTDLLSKVAGLMIDLRFIAFFMLCYIVARYEPLFLKHGLYGSAVGAAIVVGFGLLQLTVLPHDTLRAIGYSNDTIRPFTTIDKNPDFIRIQSTLRGPNPLGALMVVYISLLLAYVAHKKRATTARQLAVGIFGGLGAIALLLGSYSRSAVGGLLLALAVIGTYSLKVSRTAVAAGVVIAVLGGIGAWMLQSTDFYSNVVLHEDPESTVVKKSNSEHVRSLLDSTKRVVQEPLGAGIGSTGSASLYGEKPGPTIENQYLFIAHEVGWIGLGLFLALFAAILLRLWKQRAKWPALGILASGIGLAAIGMLLPVWVDDTVSLIWWGLAGGIIGSTHDRRARK